MARPARGVTDALPPLITYRLNKQQLAALNSAERVQVTFAITPANGAFTSPESTFTSKMQGRAFANALRTILMDDHTYAAMYEPRLGLPEGMRLLTFRLFHAGQTMPAFEVTLYPDSREVYVQPIDAPAKDRRPGYFVIYPLFDPRMLTLMKQAFADNAQVQALQPRRLEVPTSSPTIPPDVLKRAASPRAGMTRADLLKVYKEMGGMSSPYQRTYYMDGVSVPPRIIEEVNVNGVKVRQLSRTQALVRINARFAPRKTSLRWVDGVGIVVDPTKMYEARSSERPDDIIVHLSAPYLGGYVGD